MHSLSSKKELFLTYFLVLYCTYYLLVSLSSQWTFTTDDAYISWFYARQLVNGKGLLWHQNLPLVEGYSNFLWVIISALIIKLQFPLVSTLKWISVFSLGAGLFFLYRLGRLFFSPLLAMLPVFIFSHYQGVSWWTMSGLESTFYCVFSILLIWQCTKAMGYCVLSGTGPCTQKNISNSSWVFTNLTLFIISLIRFEGLIWIVPVTLFFGCELRKFGFKHFFHQSKQFYLWIMITFSCFIVPYAIYFTWRVHYFGDWIPNSYMCKSLKEGQIGIVDYDYFSVIAPLVFISLPYFFSPKDCRHLLLWLPSALYGVMLWKADPIITYFLRLFLGPFALYCLLPVLGVSQLKLPNWDTKITTTLFVIIFTFIFIPENNTTFNNNYLFSYNLRNQNRMSVAQILNAKAEKGATILLNDTGIIPFYGREDLRFIDSQCLNNASLSHFPYVHDIELYANYLQYQLKPDWVIVSKYPLEFHHNDFLIDLLKKEHFFSDYKLVSRLESKGCSNPFSSMCSQKSVDYVYLIYNRRK